MEKIIWTNNYCTGEKEIDSQHKWIIDQINYLIDNLKSKDTASLNHEIIKKLDKYASEHFATEERFLRKVNYLNLENHLKAHESFKLRTVHTAVKVMKGHEDVPKETIQFLKNWWSNHILKMDMEYKNLISNNR